MPYSWPSKIRKYGITCPFQRVLVAKYENQIDWNGALITTPVALDRHICERMLPVLRQRIDSGSERNHYCLTVNLDHMLANPAPHLDKARQLRQCKGEEATTKFLLDHINSEKKSVFESWWTYVTQENPVYQAVPAFQYLILRPVFESSDAKCTRAPVQPDAAALAFLYDDIKAEAIGPADHLLRKLCSLMAFGARTAYDAESFGMAHRWVSVTRKEPRAANRVAALSQGSGWCVASPGMAASYLRSSDFHILVAEGHPLVAIRSHNCVAVEIEGRSNSDPGRLWPHVLLFCNARALQVTHRSGDAATTAKALRRKAASINEVEKMAEYLAHDPARVQFVPDDAADDVRFKDLVERAWRVCIASDPCCAGLTPAWMASDPKIYRALEKGWCELLRVDAQNVTRLPHRLQTSELVAPAKCKAWVKLVESEPMNYERCPPELQKSKDIRCAWRKAWVKIVRSDMTGYARCPPELRQEKQILGARRWPWVRAIKLDPVAYENCPEDIRRFPSIGEARRLSWVSSFTYDKDGRSTCPPDVLDHLSQTDNLQLCAAFLARILTLDTPGRFSDTAIPPAIRARPDFARVRELGWAAAIDRSPLCQLRLPDDLRKSSVICQAVKPKYREQLQHLAGLIRITPWLLHDQKMVPKPLLKSRELFDAYFEGWHRQLRNCPWRIWHLSRKGARSYMTPSTLYHPQVIDGMTEGWIDCAGRLQLAEEWRHMEASTLCQLPVQLAVLRALERIQLDAKLRRKIVLAVVNAKKSTENCSSSCYQEMLQEIRSILSGTQGGFLGS